MNLELSSSNTFTDDETSSSKYLTVNDVLNKCNVDKMYKDDRGVDKYEIKRVFM